MKTIITCVGYGLALFITVSCSQPESEDPVIDTSADVREVTSEYMDELMTAYKSFVENLPEEEKNRLVVFVNSMSERSQATNGRTMNDVECHCLATQAYCSAKGSTGECCICWDPETQIGACGKYMGIAFCRADERPTKSKDDEKIPTPPKSSTTIKIYPKEMQTLVDYIENQRLGVGSNQSNTGLKDFKKLLGIL
jgi:hypothetical protein